MFGERLGRSTVKMSKKPPIRPGITFEVGARVEAQDYLQKWYKYILKATSKNTT